MWVRRLKGKEVYREREDAIRVSMWKERLMYGMYVGCNQLLRSKVTD